MTAIAEITSVPDVMDALVTLWRATEFPDPPVKVIDGPTREQAFTDRSLSVGYQDDDAGALAVEGAGELEGYAGSREQYTVNNAITVLVGKAGMAAARHALFAIYRPAIAALGNRQLGGLVLSMTPTPWGLTQQQISKGLVARLQFGIAIDALVKG